jgi:hypothetical protein
MKVGAGVKAEVDRFRAVIFKDEYNHELKLKFVPTRANTIRIYFHDEGMR